MQGTWQLSFASAHDAHSQVQAKLAKLPQSQLAFMPPDVLKTIQVCYHIVMLHGTRGGGIRHMQDLMSLGLSGFVQVPQDLRHLSSVLPAASYEEAMEVA